MEELVFREERRLLGGRDPVEVPALVGRHVERQHGECAPHRVDVGCHGRAGLDDLRRLKPGRAVQVAVVLDARDGTEVDQLEGILGDHHVVGFEVVVHQTGGVQIRQCGKDFEHVGDGLLDRHAFGLRVRRQDVPQRVTAHVLHHDVPHRGPVRPGMLHEVEDLHDARVGHLARNWRSATATA